MEGPGLWPIYHPRIPPVLRHLSATPPMARLRQVGMNCGCEYTDFPRFRHLAPYSRFRHSVGVGLIVWHFTHDAAQAAAGLLHDISTPVFAHVVDFLRGDHLTQTATEHGTAALIAASPEICRVLAAHGLTLEQVCDYHRYPVADNDAPRLSADRLEYTLGNAVNYGFLSMNRARALYRDLTVIPNEDGAPELAFRTRSAASAFTAAALNCARVYVADEDRFAMEALAWLLRRALDRGVLDPADLKATEPQVIAKLLADPVCGPLWSRFRSFARLRRAAERPDGGEWYQVAAKLRWIDPLAAGAGRVSRWDTDLAAEMEAFRRTDFSPWLSGEPQR